MEELEKNYGVYLDVDDFIKDMNQKLKEIKTYKDFYKYIGTDYGKDKTDLELIINAYKKAKEKGYIRINRSLSNTINTQSINNRSGNDWRNSIGNSRNDWRNSRDLRYSRNDWRNRRSRSPSSSDSYSSRSIRYNNNHNRRRRSRSRERRGGNRHYNDYRYNYY